MIDDPRKTTKLMETLKGAVPFEVELTPQLAATLKGQSIALDSAARHLAAEVFYAGDPGGFMCRILSPAGGDTIVVSLTHLAVRKPLPFAEAVTAYQKHRVKKLKKQR